MPATDYQGSSSPFNNFGRSILSIRRDHIDSMEASSHDNPSTKRELDSFQKLVTERFVELSSVGPDDLLSLTWIRKLLDAFLRLQEEFSAIMSNNMAVLAQAPMDRIVADFFERNVKMLDVCNAIRDGIEQIRQWKKLLEIVLVALENQRSVGEGQFRRAKKALIDLAIGMLDGKDSNSSLPHRNRSFGRNNASRENWSLGNFRSLSWSVSRVWSAARQLQAIGNNLAAPRGNEIVASHGLVVPVFTMSSVLLFVTWALVAAIPCQDRGLQVNLSIPRQYTWAAPILLLHERIMEESKRRDRRNSCGLLKEIHQIEKCARHMNELADSVQFPMTEEKEGEVRQRVQELAQVCEAIKDGLDPLERQVREVFHRIVRSRTEGLDSLARAN